VRVYAVVSEQMSDEALELFVHRQMDELMVENWNRDEPDRAGSSTSSRSSSRAFFRSPDRGRIRRVYLPKGDMNVTRSPLLTRRPCLLR
jgi:hypothetical protein